MNNRTIAIGLLWMTCLLGSLAKAEIAIIAHPSNTTTALSSEEATKIFLGKSSRFPNGEQAVPLDQSEGNEARTEFYSKVAKKTPSQLNAYWSRLIFTGKGQPPKAVEDDDEVLELVEENPNIIGYISSGSVTPEVKVLLTVP